MSRLQDAANSYVRQVTRYINGHTTDLPDATTLRAALAAEQQPSEPPYCDICGEYLVIIHAKHVGYCAQCAEQRIDEADAKEDDSICGRLLVLPNGNKARCVEHFGTEHDHQSDAPAEQQPVHQDECPTCGSMAGMFEGDVTLAEAMDALSTLRRAAKEAITAYYNYDGPGSPLAGKIASLDAALTDSEIVGSTLLQRYDANKEGA